MQTPLVSVCMTTYNHAPYLREAIEGVLAQQTPFGVELVLSDDCSTDGTAAICREYAAKYPDRVQLVEGPVNVGWRANYRRTIDACRGRYVAICDGDDWWSDPHKLRMQAELLEADPACGMCYTRTQRYNQSEGTYVPFPPACYDDFAHISYRGPVDNCSTLARRELIMRYYAEVRPEEHPEWPTDDHPMCLWFSLCSRIRHLDAVTAVHRVLDNSVSHSDRYRDRIAFVNAMCEIGIWMDRRYGDGSRVWPLTRKRMSDALWVLSYHGSVGEYLARWWRDVRACPRLALCAEGPGLLVKKILFRRSKNRRA